MRTYQDLEALGENEASRMSFIRAFAAEHCGTPEYRVAMDAEEYYAKRNVTILKYEKIVMNAMGQAVPDVWSSNYKLTHGFFRQFVLQQVQYVLSNGVVFQDDATKPKLGADFDNKLQTLAKKAMVDGVAFGFWNYDHLDVFSFVGTPKEPGFAPLYDQDTGLLRAGVRYWQPTAETKRWTLYEQDGYTDYIERQGDNMQPMADKRPYMTTVTATEAGGIEEIQGANYPGFPIIPIYANDLRESEIVGIRPSIDCYDFVMSGMANNIDETSVFYWTLQQTGGMDDADLVQFVARMKQLHAVVLGPDVSAEAHTLSIPVEANKVLLDYLKDDMYENFMLMNPSQVLSGNLTATAIRMAYQQQDDKCGDFEYCIRDFITKLFRLLGIDDEPSFKWNRVANYQDETNMVMTASSYLDDEAVLNHLPWLTPEEVDDILKRKDNDTVGRIASLEQQLAKKNMEDIDAEEPEE
ncbi:MAG: phage portal protein [Oscillospiraceae bacterium]|nr:phage portal protein [Oscillospiraceae bacterium]